MKGKRQTHPAPFKAQVALAALKGDRTVNELAGQYGLHPTLVHAWKKQLLAGAAEIFTGKRSSQVQPTEATEARLYEEIGRLKMELDWVKKKAAQLG
jgi:putative transposase